MNTESKQKRNRIIALSFVSVLMLLVYGPLAQWFIAADRVVYDQIAARAPNMSLSDGFIVSIDPKRSSKSEILAQYGRIIETLQNNSVKRIILASPPDVSADAELPAWSALLSARIPVFVPTRHRFSDVAEHHGFVEFNPDDDRILRQTTLWQLNNGIYSPSLPLAASRLTPTDDSWTVDNAIAIDPGWHGAVVVSRSDGKVIGVLLVDEDDTRVALMPELSPDNPGRSGQ